METDVVWNLHMEQVQSNDIELGFEINCRRPSVGRIIKRPSPGSTVDYKGRVNTVIFSMQMTIYTLAPS